jgi:hypothetical protein
LIVDEKEDEETTTERERKRADFVWGEGGERYGGRGVALLLLDTHESSYRVSEIRRKMMMMMMKMDM